MKPIHERAVEWALGLGYFISVTDISCDVFSEDPADDEWDIKHSTDKAEIMAAIEGTDLPNVYIFTEADDKTYQFAFSVIDEGVPLETINDYTMSNRPVSMAFDKWFSDVCDEG